MQKTEHAAFKLKMEQLDQEKEMASIGDDDDESENGDDVEEENEDDDAQDEEDAPVKKKRQRSASLDSSFSPDGFKSPSQSSSDKSMDQKSTNGTFYYI